MSYCTRYNCGQNAYHNCICIADILLLLLMLFLLFNFFTEICSCFPWRQSQLTWNFNIMCIMVSVCVPAFLWNWPIVTKLEPFKNLTHRPVCDRHGAVPLHVQWQQVDYTDTWGMWTACIIAVARVWTSHVIHSWLAGMWTLNFQSDPQTVNGRQTMQMCFIA